MLEIHDFAFTLNFNVFSKLCKLEQIGLSLLFFIDFFHQFPIHKICHLSLLLNNVCNMASKKVCLTTLVSLLSYLTCLHAMLIGKMYKWNTSDVLSDLKGLSKGPNPLKNTAATSTRYKNLLVQKNKWYIFNKEYFGCL